MRTRFIGLIATVLVILLTGCPDTGTFTPDPELKFTNITVSQTRASAGDEIEITWDFENPDLLAAQNIQGLSLLFNGISISQPAPLALEDRTFTTPEARRFLEFFSQGKRSFARARRAGMEEAEG